MTAVACLVGLRMCFSADVPEAALAYIAYGLRVAEAAGSS